ncbi:MAG: hypothetical protein L0Z53_01095, partial [Acidobacteriales bacterium]|nr:hypothetical protein [Terriglobales bacterium]
MRARSSFQQDFHWTPMTQRLPLEAGERNFEVYIADHQLKTMLQAGRLGMKSEEGWKPIAASDVTVRINHIDRVTRAPLLAGVAAIAAALGWIAGLLFGGRLARQGRTMVP